MNDYVVIYHASYNKNNNDKVVSTQTPNRLKYEGRLPRD